jgi:hypothetical protein
MTPEIEITAQDCQADLEEISVQLGRLAALVEAGAASVTNPGQSRWTVGQQAVHVALVSTAVAKSVARILRGRSVPSKPLSPEARAILTAGEIPRGTAEAPEAFRIEEPPSDDATAKAIALARERWAGFEDLAAEIVGVEGALPHPLLGPLDAAVWVRFAGLHGAHHLAIVRDILLA